jgi:16S rRNA (cytosine967-C5)-methyltransferase
VLACLAGAKPGERVVDFCAGAGGKSLAMAQMMDNKGVIYACDVHDKRLDNLGKRARRAGVHNIRSKVLSSERDKWVKQHSGYADLVLVDAPCSGTGTWRRNPDSRWNLSVDDLDELQTLQASILDSASRLVKPGGRLIYATCSFLQRENEDQVAKFLEHHPEFSSIQLTLQNGEDVLIESPTVRLLSSVHETDGFFAAGFTRNTD